MKDRLIFDVTDAQTIAATDSVGAWIRAGDDGTLIGHVSDALKVNFSNTTIAVTATNLDIRDLTQTDEVTVFQGTSPWVVSGTVELGATTLAALETITVVATDLDIRDIDYTQDNIAIMGATGNQLVVNADGSLNVNADISVVNGSDKAEDSAHVSADIGTYILAVRQDTLANSVSADGDYASLKVDATGALYTNITNTLSVSDAALANTAILSTSNVLGVADTAEAIIASALAARKYLYVYNVSNTKSYIGASGVTAANGFPVSGGSYLELRCGAAVSPFFVGEAGKTPELRTLELS